MRKNSLFAGAVLVSAMVLATDLSAQFWEAGRPGQDVATLAILGGAISPTTTLPDGSSHSSGAAVGIAGTWWFHRFAGVRGSFTYTQVEGQAEPSMPFSAAATQDPTIWLYGIDLTLRYPVVADGYAVSPYLMAGPGGKSYRWSIENPRIGDSGFAWSYGGGVDVRPTRSGSLGIVLEVENHRSRYMWHGLGLRAVAPDYQAVGPLLNDIVFSAGLTLSR
jgi:opacity protein-like surface antigen